MKYYLLLIPLLLLAACMQRPQDTIDAPGDTVDTVNNASHTLCENGACTQVNGCPQGYDEFQSQTGPSCVKHYGKEEISTWPTCKKSSNGCACTYTSRDTLGKGITWDSSGEGLRCAPENYRDYMVFGGLSGVDEKGQDYAMIA